MVFSSGPALVEGAPVDFNLRTDDICPPRRVLTNRTWVHTAEATGGAAERVMVTTADYRDIAPTRRRRSAPGRDALHVGDIEGASPARVVVRSRKTNPLDPQYNYLGGSQPEPLVPRFVRDSLTTADIEGARPRPRNESRRPRRGPARDPVACGDVPGAAPAKRHEKINRRGVPESLNVRDITHPHFVSGRSVNPLSPTYTVGYTDSLIAHHDGVNDVAGSVEVGDIAGSHPRGLRRERRKEEQYALQTQDVCAAKPARARRQWREPNVTADIPGAQADTVKYFHSGRATDPLSPTYPKLSGGGGRLPYMATEKERWETAAASIGKARAIAKAALLANDPDAHSTAAICLGYAGPRVASPKPATAAAPVSKPAADAADTTSAPVPAAVAGAAANAPGGEEQEAARPAAQESADSAAASEPSVFTATTPNTKASTPPWLKRRPSEVAASRRAPAKKKAQKRFSETQGSMLANRPLPDVSAGSKSALARTARPRSSAIRDRAEAARLREEIRMVRELK